jgi:DNA-directed RNA polymerase subunit F
MTTILNQKPVTLAEVKALVKNIEEKETLNEYMKKFSKLSLADATKLMQELSALNNIKLREEHFVKIADFLPQDSEDLAKVVSEVSLSDEESQAILAVVKKY